MSVFVDTYMYIRYSVQCTVYVNIVIKLMLFIFFCDHRDLYLLVFKFCDFSIMKNAKLKTCKIKYIIICTNKGKILFPSIISLSSKMESILSNLHHSLVKFYFFLKELVLRSYLTPQFFVRFSYWNEMGLHEQAIRWKVQLV